MVSLIMATIGRHDEIIAFLDSLDHQECMDFELIIVDQNYHGYLDDILRIERSFQIHHILSKEKGLSKNRNIGIDLAKGEILAFPDDDCVYYEDTVRCIIDEFNRNFRLNMVVGRIFDREFGLNIIKRWPSKAFHVRRKDLYKISSSITIFAKRIGLKFDEHLGAGATYPSNEDFDFMARVNELYGGIYYCPAIEVWHPYQTYESIPLDKVFNYGRGFGYCAKKLQKHSLYYSLLFSQAIVYHIFSLVLGLACIDLKRAKYSFCAISGRIRGWREN